MEAAGPATAVAPAPAATARAVLARVEAAAMARAVLARVEAAAMALAREEAARAKWRVAAKARRR